MLTQIQNKWHNSKCSSSSLIFFLILSFEQIIDNGCAYVVSGDVYFSVDNFPEYGKLFGRKLDDNRSGERVAIDDRKKNPADFAQ
jgi:cysteinyl-tRNA synthetase